jgi:hypothetical protein
VDGSLLRAEVAGVSRFGYQLGVIVRSRAGIRLDEHDFIITGMSRWLRLFATDPIFEERASLLLGRGHAVVLDGLGVITGRDHPLVFVDRILQIGNAFALQLGSILVRCNGRYVPSTAGPVPSGGSGWVTEVG